MQEQRLETKSVRASARRAGCDLACIFAVVLAGATVRVLLLPQRGWADMQWFAIWAVQMHQGSWASAYELDIKMPPSLKAFEKANYPPGVLYVLRGTTTAYRWVAGRDLGFDVIERSAKFPDEPQARAFFVTQKSPAVLADLATGVLLYLVLRRRVGRAWATAVGALFLLQPGVIYNSARWGQVDAINTFFMVLSLELAYRRRYVLMSGVAALALLIKVQSIVLAPLWVLCLVLGESRPAPGEAPHVSLDDRLQALCTRRRMGRIASAIGLAAALSAAICAPFIAGGVGRAVARAYSGALGRYPAATACAFNLWGLAYPLRDTEDFHWVPDTTRCAGIPLRAIGMGLLAAGTLVVVVKVVRQPEALAALQWGSLALCLAFFAFPTQIHERYLHPALAIAAWAFVRRWWWWGIWIAIGVVYALNVMWVFPPEKSWPGSQLVEWLAPHPAPRVELTDVSSPLLRDALLKGNAVLTNGGVSTRAASEHAKPREWYPSRPWGFVISVLTVTMLVISPRAWRDEASRTSPQIAPTAAASGDAAAPS